MRRRGKQRLLAVLIASALFTSAARISFAYLHYREVKSHFPRVRPGMPREHVLLLLGSPNYHEGKCGVITPVRNGCVSEYVYSHPMAPLFPEYFVVTFSASGRVIEAEPWNSP